MAEVVACAHDGYELVYDTDDVESFSTPRDVVTTAGDNGQAVRQLGKAHLTIDFKPGRQPLWRQAAGRENPVVPGCRDENCGGECGG